MDGIDPAAMLNAVADDGFWARLGPHFGGRAINGAVQALQQQVPAIPALDAALQNARASAGAALEPLRSVARPPPGLDLGAAAAALNSNLTGSLDNLSGSLSAVSSAASGAGAWAGSALSGAAAGLPSIKTAGSLPLLPAALGDVGQVLESAQPHFGTTAVSRGVDALVQWVAGQFHDLEVLDPALASSLTSALSDLRQAAAVMTLPPVLGGSAAGSLQQLGMALSVLQASLQGLTAGVGSEADSLLAQLSSIWAQAQENGIGGNDLATVSLTAACSLVVIAASVPATGYEGPGPAGPDDSLGHEYSPDVLAAYFSRRPLAVMRRSAQVAAEAASFGAALMLDIATGQLKANEPARAQQLRGTIERLGPAYVKVAQAMSTRVDLLTPAYFEQVQRLQDRVPPFPCEEAKRQMEKAFGQPVSEVFSTLSERPVAAASLGQVYRATMRPGLGGSEVAVKVQRPDVLEQVGLDLLIMRRLAVAMKDALQMNTDWAAVIDAWAVRFFHEMDYEREAANAELFETQMAQRGVDGITVATVVHSLSNDVVLTTSWVDGEKLSESHAADIRSLCNTLLNCYLIQLLDTGHLHADPHPGNLMRTPDGKICILDWGLVTEVTPEQRVALVEYIAHLSTQDWEKLARDLQVLGFIPPEVDTREAGLVEPLGRIMSQLTGGGGAAKVNIDKVMADLEALGNDYPFQVPPFFALILRAFSVIEGIALRVDPNYAIVAECFPYLAKRLLNDDSPRMRAVLRDILYGNKQRLDAQRLIRFADALSAYTTDGIQPTPALATTAAAALSVPGSVSVALQAAGAATPATATALVVAEDSTPVLSPVVAETLRSVLRPGSYVQQLLVEELVVAVDALSRDALSRVLRIVLASAPATVALRSVEALGPLRGVLLPVPTPIELLNRLAPVVALTAEDRDALAVVQAILQLVSQVGAVQASTFNPAVVAVPAATSATGRLAAASQPAAASALAPSGASNVEAQLRVQRTRRLTRAVSELGALAPELAPGMAATGELFVRLLTRRVATRLVEGLRATGVAGPLQGPLGMALSMFGGPQDDTAAWLSGSSGSTRPMVPPPASKQQQQRSGVVSQNGLGQKW